MLRASSLSAGLPPRKSGMAIGTGWTLPSVTSSLSTAPAGSIMPAAAMPAAPASSRQRAVLLEADQNGDFELVGIGGPGGRIPALAQPGAQRIELALGEPRRLARCRAVREGVIEGVPGRSDALRIAFIEQRRDAIGI